MRFLEGVGFFKVENNSFELTCIFQNIFVDPIVSARREAEKSGRHEERERERNKERDVSASTPSSVSKDGVDAETSLSFFLSLFMSISLLHLFLAHTIGSINIF